MAGAIVTAELTDAARARLVVSTSSDLSNPVRGDYVEPSDRFVRMEITGLDADTLYHYGVEADETLGTLRGKFRTLPSASFTVCFSSCATADHAVFDTIRGEDPNLFIHMGDMHYEDRNVDDPEAYITAYENVFSGANQARLYREVATPYVFDDHDYCGNDTGKAATGRDAVLEAYRRRVPHYPLDLSGTTDAIYHSFEVGRCVFIMTDLRSEADDKSKTDDSSKTMMGSAQKTWFKNLIAHANNAGKCFVWVSSRVFHANVEAGFDHWGGFSTERVELADHIKANAPGRLIVLTGDRHQAGIDDGTNCDYATGGDPLPCCMAAPLAQTTNTHGDATFSEGVNSGQRQYGKMTVTDTGGSTITVLWELKDHEGTLLSSHQFTVDLS